MRAWQHPWSITAAAVVGAMAVAAVASAYEPSDVQGVRGSVNSWLLGSAPELADPRTRRFSGARAEVSRIAIQVASAQGVDPSLVLAVAHLESGMRPAHAVTGPPTRYGRAVGTMQVLPSTGRAIGCGNLRDTRQNIECGVRYLRMGLQRCGGNVECAARFYHGGPNTRIHGTTTAWYGRRIAAQVRGRTMQFASTGTTRSGCATPDDRFPHTWRC